MSIKTATFYAIQCDWPGCGRLAEDGEFHRFWDGLDTALDCARDDQWWEGIDDDNYCTDHPMHWASDDDLGEPRPTIAHLLIHDGDTDDHNDDGRVSYIGGDSA